MTVTLYEDYQVDMFIAPRCVILRIRNISGKLLHRNQTHVSCSIFYFENCASYETTSKNTKEPKRPEMTIKYGACGLNAGYLRLQTHTHNI